MWFSWSGSGESRPSKARLARWVSLATALLLTLASIAFAAFNLMHISTCSIIIGLFCALVAVEAAFRHHFIFHKARLERLPIITPADHDPEKVLELYGAYL